VIIRLEYPYTLKWRRGYVIFSKSEGRRNVVLYNSPTDKTTTPLARYKMAVHLGRFLLASEHVDHKDNNKRNDDITNLQILSQKKNNQKLAEYLKKPRRDR
jgi:hypothetical protein